MKKFSLVTKIDHSKVLELFEDVSITDHSENQYHTKNMNDDMRKTLHLVLLCDGEKIAGHLSNQINKMFDRLR